MARILVVDDEPDLQVILRMQLSSWGHEVDAAADAEEAAAACAAVRYDALLLDLSLPRVNGLDLLARLRAEGTAPEAVALLSATPPEQLAGRAAAAGIHHLAKPFGLDELQALVRQLVGE